MERYQKYIQSKRKAGTLNMNKYLFLILANLFASVGFSGTCEVKYVLDFKPFLGFNTTINQSFDEGISYDDCRCIARSNAESLARGYNRDVVDGIIANIKFKTRDVELTSKLEAAL